jgi:serine/threonine protein kinase
MDFSIPNINGLFMRSKLLTPDEVNAIHQRWKVEGKDRVDSMRHYLKWIVANNYLTEYQASLISRGHADQHDFFLGQYKILDRLGQGRMAGVYKAAHQSGQVVAIKVLPPSRAKDSHMLARFQREARLAMQLKHPNVVRSFQLGETAGLHYLVMEYLDGETLDDVLKRRKKLPVNESVRLIHQALQGLQHIYEKNFLHRDLKPANLMLVPAPAPGEPDTTLGATVKILDIGLGRELFDETAQAVGQKLELTGEGVLLGTPDYLAPEQARDPRGIDIRSDIYSLGCVLYHCLAGQPPFPDKNVLSQMVRHATEPLRPVRDFTPDVPDGLQQALNFMLAKDTKQRYPTPERAAGSLQVFMIAGAPVRAIDEAPVMKKFLTSLELDDFGSMAEKPAAAAPVGRPPTPVPAPVLPATNVLPNPNPAPALVAATAPAAKAKGRDKVPPHQKKAQLARASVPVAAPFAPAPAVIPAAQPPATVPAGQPPIDYANIDVELVPVPGPPMQVSGPGPTRGRVFTRRDWLLLIGGGGAAIGAVLIGWLLHKFFPKPD